MIIDRGHDRLYIPDDVVIFGDGHGAYLDGKMVDKAILVGETLKIRTIVIHEIINADEVSKFPDKSKGTTWKVDCPTVEDALVRLSKQFETAIMFPGNHESRIMNITHGMLRMKDIAKLIIPEGIFKAVFTTDQKKVFVGDTWMVSHSDEYSRIPCKKPYDLGMKYGRNCVQGHSHTLNELTVYADGKRQTYIDGGCTADPVKILYAELDATTFPESKQAIVAIANEQSFIYTDEELKEVKTSLVNRMGVATGKVLRRW